MRVRAAIALVALVANWDRYRNRPRADPSPSSAPAFRPHPAPRGITLGPDGNIWFTEQTGNRIGRITPSRVVAEFSVGLSPDANPGGMALGPDGNVWFVEPGNRIGRITTAGDDHRVQCRHQSASAVHVSIALGLTTTCGSWNSTATGSVGSPRPARSPSSARASRRAGLFASSPGRMATYGSRKTTSIESGASPRRVSSLNSVPASLQALPPTASAGLRQQRMVHRDHR